VKETNGNEWKRNEWKRNETNGKETKRNETKRKDGRKEGERKKKTEGWKDGIHPSIRCSRDISVLNIQPARILQYKTFSYHKLGELFQYKNLAS
jgi:hypothetical protein